MHSAVSAGLKSVSCLGDEFFGTGIIIEEFHKSGTWLQLSDL